MISVEDAQQRITASFKPVPAETVGLSAALLNRVLAEDVIARRSQPPFAASAMDGWAVRSADLASLPARLKPIGVSSAGHGFRGSLAAGQAVRIFTGAAVPEGADKVIPQENVEAEGSVILVREAGGKTHIRKAGLDFREGETMIKAGGKLGVRDLALAAAMNVPWLAVRRRPRVAILATGDELVRPGEPLGPDQIISSLGLGLCALVTSAGAEATDLGITADDAEDIGRNAKAAMGADLLLTIGGASVGEADLVHRVLGGAGASIDFWQVAMRPGKPLMFGKAFGEIPLIGLPGNPVSALVCGLLFVVPAIQSLLGLPPSGPPIEWAVSGSDLPANDKRQDYLRATLAAGDDGRLVALAAPVQDSSMLSTLAEADCLLIRPPLAPPIKASDRVPIIRLQDLGF
jgi:molybdopterin molybdotransferase